MSSLWTPDGERPVGRPGNGTPPEQPRHGLGVDDDREPTEAELEAMAEEMAQQILATPAEAFIIDHCLRLFQLAQVYLSAQPPQLGSASLSIDAIGGIVEALGERLGADHDELQTGLASLRMAYVQIRGANLGAP